MCVRINTTFFFLKKKSFIFHFQKNIVIRTGRQIQGKESQIYLKAKREKTQVNFG